MNHQPQIYLASSSPRRQEILQQMGVSFAVIPQRVEEETRTHESPEELVIRLALEKSKDGLKRQNNQKIPVLGSDTIVVLNGEILGKPDNKEQSIEMLLSLSDKTHQVMTAVVLANERHIKKAISISEVTFSQLDRNLCENYWQTNEPVDKAGSYGIQGQAALFIKNINGSYSGVMGLPVYETGLLLNQFGINLL
ncbi:MAG: Maf family nucleotide pyrophosphatase [gamma proteobacterium symbiont of Taylorina sp.]|nr:Maf family nucleotide pyrophosphatase [gamma proteobacterium symbiont of Taylorina sp.]